MRCHQPSRGADLGRDAHRRRGRGARCPERARGPGENPTVRGGDEERERLGQRPGAPHVLLDLGEVARVGVEAQQAVLSALAQRDGRPERRVGLRTVADHDDPGRAAAQEPGLPRDAAADAVLVSGRQHGAVGRDEHRVPVGRVQGEPRAQARGALVGGEQAVVVAERQSSVARLAHGLPQPRRDGGDVGARGRVDHLLRGRGGSGLGGRHHDQEGGREPRRGGNRHLQRVEQSEGDLQRLRGHPYARGSVPSEARFSLRVD